MDKLSHVAQNIKGLVFIKQDQLDSWIKVQLRIENAVYNFTPTGMYVSPCWRDELSPHGTKVRKSWGKIVDRSDFYLTHGG